MSAPPKTSDTLISSVSPSLKWLSLARRTVPSRLNPGYSPNAKYFQQFWNLHTIGQNKKGSVVFNFFFDITFRHTFGNFFSKSQHQHLFIKRTNRALKKSTNKIDETVTTCWFVCFIILIILIYSCAHLCRYTVYYVNSERAENYC